MQFWLQSCLDTFRSNTLPLLLHKTTTDVWETFWVNYLKCVFSRCLTVCTSISPVGCCALASGFACGPGGPLVAQAVCADCAAICWEWTAGPGPVGQAFTCKRETGPQTSWLIKTWGSRCLDSGADSVIRKGRGYQSNAKTWLKTKTFIRSKAFRPVKVCKYKTSPNYYSLKP